MSDTVLFEQDPRGIAVITVNRPEVRNALNPEAMAALSDAVTAAEQSGDLRAVILCGAGGRAFISGGDLRALRAAASELDGLQQYDLMAATLDRLAALPVPVIAALEGATRGGGCEIMLACDVAVAAQNATLGFAQINMAVTPGWGGAERLLARVGYARAVDLLLTGRVLSATEALEIGLVTHLCPPGKALHMATMMAELLAEGPARAVCGVKHVLRGYLTLPPEAARERERAVFGELWASADHGEASAAFLENRDPLFRGE